MTDKTIWTTEEIIESNKEPGFRFLDERKWISAEVELEFLEDIYKQISVDNCEALIKIAESIKDLQEHKAHCKRELKFLESLHLESFNSNCDCADCRTTIEILIRRIKDLQEAMK